MITRKTPIKNAVELGKDCRMCGHCCSYGTGFATKDELQKIADYLHMLKEELTEKYFEKAQIFNKEIHRPKTKKKPFGPCVFLKKNKCQIHDVKPLHCRIGNCGEHGENLSEWYASNFLVDKDDPESIRQWAIRVDLKPTIKGASPEEIVGDKNKLRDILNYKKM